MDAPQDRATDPAAATVRLSDPGEVAASLPALLGFRPRESVVVVALTGTRGRVGVTVRGDIPVTGGAAALAAALTRGVRTGRPDGVLVAVVSEAPDLPATRVRGDDALPGIPHRRLVHEIVLASAAAGVRVREALLVRAGRWWSYGCPRPCCAPGAGTPLPAGVPTLEAASVAMGVVVGRDRDDLLRRITGPDGSARSRMAAACARTATECSARVREVGSDAVAEESWTAVVAAAAGCRPGAPRAALTDREVARVLWGLRDVDVRDRAVALATGRDAPAAEVLWTECTRRAPAPLDVAPATLLAISAWLRGDGATANVALDRALAREPGYPLAVLLAEALARGLPPAELRAVIEAGPVRPGARGRVDR